MVNVTKSNFIEQSNSLLQHLPTADFISIDEEMTGICLPNSKRPPKDHNPTQRYEFLKSVPERYSIIQLGVCLFHKVNKNELKKTTKKSKARNDKKDLDEHDDDGNEGGTEDEAEDDDEEDHDDGDDDTPEYFVRKYNFYVFPPSDNTITREVVLNPSSVAFLNQHNMNFDLWSQQGIPFVTKGIAKDLIHKYNKRKIKQLQVYQQNSNKKNGNNNHLHYYRHGGRTVELRRTEDIDFHARAMASLREWLDAANIPTPTPVITTAHTLSPHQHLNGENQIHIDQQEEQRQILINGSIPPQPPRTATTAAATEGVSFLLPPCNSFLRRALYESIQAEYPTLILEPANSSPNDNNSSKNPNLNNQIRVWRLNPEEKRRRIERILREGWEDLIVNQLETAMDVKMTIDDEERDILSGNDNDYEEVEEELKDGDVEETTTATKASLCSFPSGNERRRRIPLVVHNGYMDLMFLLTHFHSHQLPDSYSEAKSLIRHYFPIVYDTKVMSTECAPQWSDCTRLESLFMKIIHQNNDEMGLFNKIRVVEKDDSSAGDAVVTLNKSSNSVDVNCNDNLPVVPVPSSFSPDSAATMSCHEASYDAYMTGAIFIGLCRSILMSITRENNNKYYDNQHNRLSSIYNSSSPLPSETRVRTISTLNMNSNNEYVDTLPCDNYVAAIFDYSLPHHLLVSEDNDDVKYLFGRNMLYMMMTMYTIDLENPTKDPLSRGMLPESTFRVSNLDPTITTGDIVRCLSGLFDSNRRRVNFEIVWVDDTTFLVAACYKQQQHQSALTIASDDVVTATTTTPSRGNQQPQQHLQAEEEQQYNNSCLSCCRQYKLNYMNNVLDEHGVLIYEALTNRFENECIIRLDDHLRKLEKEIRAKNSKSNEGGEQSSGGSSGKQQSDSFSSSLSSFFGNFFSFVGSAFSKDNNDDKKKRAGLSDKSQDGNTPKRRRLV